MVNVKKWATHSFVGALLVGRVVRGFELRWWLLAEFFGVAEDLRKISRIV